MITKFSKKEEIIAIEFTKRTLKKVSSLLSEDYKIGYKEGIEIYLRSNKKPEEKCPHCESDNTFSIELKHSKCKDCKEKWTN